MHPRLALMVGLCAALWVGSLLLPALSFRFDGEADRVLAGYQILASGYFHLLVLEFSWAGNLVFWLLVWMLWKRASNGAVRIASAALLLLTAQSVQIFLFPRFFQFPQPYPGYFLWVAANVGLALAALTGPRTVRTGVSASNSAA